MAFSACGPITISGSSFTVVGTPPSPATTVAFGHLLAQVDVSAFYDAAPNGLKTPRCASGSRVEILAQTTSWMTRGSNHPSSILWISGEKGVGKSVIGRTVADKCKDGGCLLTTYFIRNDIEFLHRVERSFAATIAYGVSVSFPETRKFILDAVEKEPTIFQLSLGAQFGKLVVTPILQAIKTSGAKRRPHVVILDGLDHLEDDGVRREILRVFSNNSSAFPKVLFLSRGDTTVSRFFHHPQVSQISKIISIDDDWEWEATSASESLFSGGNRSSSRWSYLIEISNEFKESDKGKAQVINEDDIVVLVMGPTGSGKSNFIDTLTKHTSPELRADDGLVSGDKEVKAVRVSHPKYKNRLVLVDTPGFDDTDCSDREILGIVGTWLKKTYEEGKKLSGILYLHRITDNRLGGTPHRNLRMFAELCGEKATNMVVFVSTMWDLIESELGETREKELKDGHWKTMLRRGAATMRFNNTENSAMEIIDYLNLKNSQDAVLLQEELAVLKKCLSETSAGLVLYDGIETMVAKRIELTNQIAERNAGTNYRLSDPMSDSTFQQDQDILRVQAGATAAQLRRMKIPIGKKIALLFLGKLRVSVPPAPLAGTAR